MAQVGAYTVLGIILVYRGQDEECNSGGISWFE